MDYLIIIGLILVVIISIILVWINFPGTFILLLVAFLIGLYSSYEIITKKILFITLISFILIEIIEFILSAITVKVYGGKNSSALLSILGGVLGTIVGSFIFPIVGSFIGLILGAYFITYYNEIKSGKSKSEAVKIANSSTLGYIISKGIKTFAILIFGINIILLIIKSM